MHITDAPIYGYYVTSETPNMSAIIADCPYSESPQYFGKAYASACTTIYWLL